jgi:hypothetical protein
VTSKKPKNPLKVFFAYVTEIDRVLHLCMRGLSGVTARPAMMETLRSVEDIITDDRKSAKITRGDIAVAKREAAWAKREREFGFPVLHAHATVALWGAVEVLVEDVCIARLKRKPELLESEELGRLTIPLGRFMNLDEDERLRLVLKQVQAKHRTEPRSGPGMLEATLKAVGLGGPLDENCRKQLHELRSVRNVIAHRSWVLDQKCVAECPWLGAQVGQEFVVSHERYSGYRDAGMRYVVELRTRQAVLAGQSREEFIAKYGLEKMRVPPVLKYAAVSKKGRFTHAYPRSRNKGRASPVKRGT